MTTAILPLYNGLFNGAVTFCGANGQSYAFQRFNADQDWAKVPGVVLFASQEGCTWRIIRVAEQGGTEGDVATFWRWREARRFGATTIFIHRNPDVKSRRAEAADLALNLDPVFAPGSEMAPVESANAPERLAA
jgi:hypothetical protein